MSGNRMFWIAGAIIAIALVVIFVLWPSGPSTATPLSNLALATLIILAGIGIILTREQPIIAGILAFLAFLLILAILGQFDSLFNWLTGGSGRNGIWFVSTLGFAVLAIVSIWLRPDEKYVPLLLLAGSGISLIMILGKLSILDWGILGIPIITGFWVAGRKFTDGKFRSFLDSICIVPALLWLILLYDRFSATLDPKFGFLKVLFPSAETIAFFAIFAMFALYGILQNKKWSKLLALFLFVCFLGSNAVSIIDRYPDKLNPSNHVSQKTKNTWEKVWDSFLKRVEEATKAPKSKGGKSSGGSLKGELVEAVRITQPGSVQNFGRFLPTGQQYCLEPWDRNMFIRFLDKPGKWEDRKLDSKGCFLVESGDKAGAIGGIPSNVKAVEIYLGM